MKNIISKIGKILLTIVLSTLVIFTDTQSVDAVANSVKIGEATLLPGYIDGMKFHIKPLSGGGYAYCMNYHKKPASNITEYYEKTLGAGMAYILENGYPNKSFTGSKKKDIYITQAAVWWYLDDTTGSNYLTNSFKTNGSDKYGLRKHVKSLVSGAKKAKEKGYSTPSVNAKVSSAKMNLSADGAYYVSNQIDANAANIDGKYEVEITSAPAGTIITSVNGNQQNKFSPSKKFLVKIPVSSIEEGKTVTAKVKVKASSTINKAYKYSPKDNTIQPVAVLKPYTKSVSDSISVKATRPKTPVVVTTPVPNSTPSTGYAIVPSKVSILKLDKDTNAAVSGAVLVLRNSNGSVVNRFTSTNEEYVINNLANGTYTLEEESAPIGYKLSTEKKTFTISDSVRKVQIKFYNKAKDSVVSILKLDKDTNSPIAGAVLVIKDSNGNVVEKVTSSVNGNTITGLSNGTYTVEEEKAPTGYELSTEKETFTLNSTTKNVQVKFYNKAKDSVVSIVKLDKNTNNPIAGAVLVVKDSNGNEIKKFTSTINGYTITGLSNGTYTVEEVTAPNGYELSSEKETFTLSDANKRVQVKFYNVPKDRVVIINKIDSVTGNPVVGAVIVVNNQNGEEVARFTSTKEAYVLNNLADGVYTVYEESSPEGYFLNEEKQTFTIDNDHLSYQITIKNVAKTCDNGGLDDDECYVAVPDTGSSSLPFYLIGITIISSGVAYVYRNNKKAYQK